MRSSSRAAALALGACLALSPRPAAAQRWQVDLGGNSVAYDTAARVNSASVAPLVEWQRRNVYAALGGVFAEFAGAQSTAEARGDVSLLFAPAGEASPFRTELLGSVDGSVHTGGYRAGTSRAEVRLHFATQTAGVWLGGTAATGWTSGGTGIASAVGPTAGAWGRLETWNVTAIWRPYRLEGYWFNELQGRVTTSLGPVDLTGYAGWRGADALSGVPNTTWGGVSCAIWVTPQVALVASGGTYPADLLQALPKGSYLSAGIRLSRHRQPAWAPSATGHVLYTEARGANVLRFAVPGATRVELVGDWTGWQPVPLRRTADGRWVLEAHLEPGVHRFNLVVDGGRWVVPEGTVAVDDGFGGKTSLLVVP